MPPIFLERLIGMVYSRQGLLVLVLVFLFSVIGGLFLNNQFRITDEEIGISDMVNEGVEISAVSSEGPVLEKSTPTRLRIPKINIDTNFVLPLDLLENGEVGVPDSYTEVGWYKYSPTPGEIGPAVILGHVDSSTGPAVFFSLGQVDEGDDIFVEREDGTTAHFRVEKLERYKQADFPTQKVYGNINYAGLRLITCTGLYSKGTQRYSHNLVVYARLVSE